LAGAALAAGFISSSLDGSELEEEEEAAFLAGVGLAAGIKARGWD